MKAVGYIRVSSEEQVKNYSLGNQQLAIEQYCAKEGHDLVEIFREEGESAKTANRTKLNQMLSYCTLKRNEIDFVIVHNFDRFARNAHDHSSIKLMLKQSGIRLISIQQPLEDDPSGRMLENIYAAVAQHDNEMRALRVVDGMRKGLEAGCWMWAAPFGYTRNEPKTSPSLFVVKEEAAIIRTAFEQVASGRTKAQVLLNMKRQGLKTRNGKSFTKQSLDGMLRNPLYAGIIDKMGVYAMGDFEPIVSGDLYNKVNSKESKQKALTHSRLHPDFPLRRFVKCSSCTKSLTGSWSKGRSTKYAYYHCENKGCRAVSLKKDALEKLFHEELGTLSIRPQTLELIQAIAQDVWAERTKEECKAKILLQAKIDNLKNRRDRLVDAYVEDKKIDQETYESRLESIKADMQEAESLMPTATISETQLSNVITKSKAMLTDLSKTWNRLEIKQKVAFQQLIYPQGLTCDGDKLGITKKSWLFIDFMDENNQKYGVVRRPGLEPGTYRLRVWCSAN